MGETFPDQTNSQIKQQKWFEPLQTLYYSCRVFFMPSSKKFIEDTLNPET